MGTAGQLGAPTTVIEPNQVALLKDELVQMVKDAPIASTRAVQVWIRGETQ
jgi:hypothetical protein